VHYGVKSRRLHAKHRVLYTVQEASTESDQLRHDNGGEAPGAT